MQGRLKIIGSVLKKKKIFKAGEGTVGKLTRKKFTWHCMLVLGQFRHWVFATLWTAAHQAPLSMGLSRQDTGVVFMPCSRVFLTQGSNLVPNWISCIAGGFFATEQPGKSHYFDDSKQFSLSHFYLLLSAFTQSFTHLFLRPPQTHLAFSWRGVLWTIAFLIQIPLFCFQASQKNIKRVPSHWECQGLSSPAPRSAKVSDFCPQLTVFWFCSF